MLTSAGFREFLFSSCHYEAGKPVLAAVSGGVDSVVLCDLLLKNEIRFGIAHVNYRLRGDESDADERFVAALAKKYNVPFYVLCCTEEIFAASGEKSIQAAARNIRYSFFETISQQEGYSFTATAHHKDDSIETALLNFARGTGIKGLTGISTVKKDIIRPLLFTTREKIVAYANAQQLEWREDSSNSTDNYTRNRFRHHLLPWLMNEIPQSYDGFEASFKRLSETEKLLHATMEHWTKACCTTENDETKISLASAQQFSVPEIYLRFFLRSNGFPEFADADISNLLFGNPGTELNSAMHRIIRDRDFIFILSKNNAGENNAAAFSFSPAEMPDEIPNEKWMALVDSQTISLPLEARAWKNGDAFIPFGMSGHKNVSDILNEMKLPLHKKEAAQVITSGNDIVWVPGYRIAEKFRITKKTASVIRLQFNPAHYGI